MHINQNHGNPNPDQAEVNKTGRNISQNTEIMCDQCDHIASGSSGLIKHIRVDHMNQGEKCQYCDYVAVSKEDLKDHMYAKREEIVMLFTMAGQLNDVYEKFDSFQSFQSDVSTALKMILDNHHSMKQELFVIRNKQVEIEASLKKKSERTSTSSPSMTSSPKRSSTSSATVLPQSTSNPPTSIERKRYILEIL